MKRLIRQVHFSILHNMGTRRFPWIGSLLVWGLTGLPYILAVLISSEERIFTGFLFNPIDGYSYMAKMYEGFQGGWLFRLPYTAEASPSGYLFVFYIALGHLARLLNLPLIGVFHGARLLSAWVLMLALWRFLSTVISDTTKISWLYYWILLGTGLGWLATLWGGFTPDFWLAEAYPFLSMFANPHFALGLGLLLFYFSILLHPTRKWAFFVSFLLGLGLGIVLPFGVVVGGVVSAGYGVWLWLCRQRPGVNAFLGLGLGGGIVLFYQYLTVLQDPWLREWNAQNLTPSPPLWDYLFAFSPALVLAILGIVKPKLESKINLPFLVVWFAAGWLMAYSPWALQRRLLVGFYIPIVILAGCGSVWLEQWNERVGRLLGRVVFALSLPTTAIVIISGLIAVANDHPLLTLDRDEYRALRWIETHTPQEALVYAAPETGLIIPAFTGRRVIYGHPFETADAEAEGNWVVATLKTAGSEVDFIQQLQERGVDYIFWGTRERDLAKLYALSSVPIVAQFGEIYVYTVPTKP